MMPQESVGLCGFCWSGCGWFAAGRVARGQTLVGCKQKRGSGHGKSRHGPSLALGPSNGGGRMCGAVQGSIATNATATATRFGEERAEERID